jgi:ATP phosphoribosyltransferase regulatory subunit
MSDTFGKQLPHGVADLFFNDAARKRVVERVLAGSFSSWGYSEIIPPMFEYYESLASEAGPQLRDDMYRFFDRDGRTLALRADFTIPTARVVGTKLFDRTMPLRFFYIGSVFRFEEPQAGVRREFTQAGIELVGARTVDADAEVIALAMNALRELGLNDFRFTLGNAAYLRALLRDVDDPAVIDSIRRKNGSALFQSLAGLALSSEQKSALSELPSLWGDSDVLDRAPLPNPEAGQAIEHLAAVIDQLEKFGLKDYITLDLAENRGMAYYTGILFEGFVEGLGFAITSGGRYDNLIAHYGPSVPAVGFAIGVERVMMARQASASIAPDVIAQEYTPRIAEARGRGQVVEVDVLARGEIALREYARMRGARKIWWRGGQEEVLGSG